MSTEENLKIALQQDKTLAKRILDFLGLSLSPSWTNHYFCIYFKKTKYPVYCTSVNDEAHAAWSVLHSEYLYDVKHDGKHTINIVVSNPFYKKSLDEIRVMLDFLETKKEV